MAVVNGCELPDHLYYDIEHGIWVRFASAELAVAGFADPFQTRAGRLLHLHPRPVGRLISRGRPAATVESAKWVGAFAMPLTGVVRAYNQAVLADPQQVNRDPYGQGWLLQLRPTALAAEQGHLLTGAAAIAAYRAKLQRDGIHCLRCAE